MPSSATGGASADSPVRSGGRPPRSFSLTNLPVLHQISEYVYGGEKQQQQQQQQQQQHHQHQGMIRRQWSAGDVEGMGRCPYSAVVKHPVPYEFQMPVHYPRFTKAHYESMPEWQVDRLLEEYGLPAQEMGSVNEKRQYAIGAFLWKDQQ